MTEHARIKALQALGVANSDPSLELDELCQLVGHFFNSRAAYVSLIDETTQWIKAAYGTSITSVPRSISICDHTIRSEDVLVIPDLAQDRRFSDSGLAKAHGIRFYAGAPLMVEEGHRVGSVCVVDPQPRAFSPSDARILEKFARVASGLLREHASARKAAHEHNLSEQRRKEIEARSQELWRQHRMMKQTERIAHVGGWEFDPDTQRATWSEEVFRIAQWQPGGEVTLDKILGLFAPSEAQQLALALESARTDAVAFDVELELARANDNWVRITGESEEVGDGRKRVFGVVRDITEIKKNQERLWRLANHDPLTGLPNRTHFGEMFSRATVAADRSARLLAVLFLDLDNFKNVNDTLGHDIGDAFLVEAGERIRSHLRPNDFVGRLGGDEFAVVLPEMETLEDVKTVADRLLKAMAEPFERIEPHLSPSISIGIAVHEKGESGERVMQNADIALYAAKSSGKAQLHFYQPAQREALEKRLSQIASFKRALANGELEPYYQPQFRIGTGQFCGFEALVRWRQPDGSVRTPADFGAALDDSEAAIELGQYMLGAVASQLAHWHEQGFDTPKVAVNVSNAELKSGRYGASVLKSLAEHGVLPQYLEIEITESVLFSDAAEVGPTLENLAKHGISIALDDFGTGYASLTHLKNFPLEKIKIDRSFVADLRGGTADLTIVRAMVDLANNLGIETVAEGVEDLDQLDCLDHLGCTYAQGYYFSKAVPAHEATMFVARAGKKVRGRKRPHPQSA